MGNEDLEERLRRIEKEFCDRTERGTDRLWRHLSNLEEQMTRRHGETDDRLSILEKDFTDITEKSITSVFTAPPEVAMDDGETKEKVETLESEIKNLKSSSNRPRPVEVSKIWSEIGAMKAKLSEITGRDLLDLKKSLNTSAQRAEVRRLSLDIENLKHQNLRPIEEKVEKLGEELKKQKLEIKSKPQKNVIEFTDRTSSDVSQVDLDGFNDKFEKFQAYWVSEAENFALKTRSEELEAEVGHLKTQLFDFSEINRKQVKELEDRSDLLEESFSKKIEAEMDMTKEYVDGKIDAFQKHGISANALEDIANLQHSLGQFLIFVKLSHFFNSMAIGSNLTNYTF